MSCEICCDTGINDSVNLWKCAGCPRRFHAACIGVHRKKSVDITSYVLPCCNKCQNYVRAELDFSELTEQQKKFNEQLQYNTEVIHRLTLQQQNASVVHEAVDRLEGQLVDLKNELFANKSSNLFAVTINNHITSLIDTAMSNTKENIADYIKSSTMELNCDLSQMREEIQQLGNLSLEIAANINQTPQDSQVEIEILEELRTLSAVIISTGNNVEHMLPPPPESCPSLADELRAELPVNPPFYPPENSGWRILDSTRRWKPDWSEYNGSPNNGSRNRNNFNNRRNNNNNNNNRNNHNIRNNNNNDNNNSNRQNECRPCDPLAAGAWKIELKRISDGQLNPTKANTAAAFVWRWN
ncbi:putative uncharacterized protein DDB_G0277255 [Toxorhynchites rutilus septentrionalis]|uniref:putative uncharacterized protein DDB_G0277255 n=1 Tax=Toxorhynchites rutilus septentrionalis TaxID=329112 RepID=UPI002478CBC4|nr:putative uncharacterized protein DDB_G0277255 [Toxorhynchites rutilus septentrionalis]